MKLLYFDCSSGICGNMTLGALTEIVGDENYLIEELKKLNVDGYKIEIEGLTKDFKWADKIPIYSIFLIDKDPEYAGYKNSEIKTTNPMLQVLSPVLEMWRKIEWNKRDKNAHRIPEGVRAIFDMHIILEQIYKGASFCKLICPKTLQEIGKGAFKEEYYLTDIELQEGLQEIGESAFESCINLGVENPLILPKSLRKIGNKAFYLSRTKVFLNDGLEEIGDEAFCRANIAFSGDYIGKRLTRPIIPYNFYYYILPSTLKNVGKDIAYGSKEIFSTFVLRNYKGQQIPHEIWELWKDWECNIFFAEGDGTEIVARFYFKYLDEYFQLIEDDKNFALRFLYEREIREKAQTDPKIARIWREYLKRRDGDENEQMENTKNVREQDGER